MVQALQAVIPERFGRYILLDRIGEGGMAEVFRAVMPGAEGFQRTFVVKRILSHLSESPQFVEMFIREARTVALLNHPNIVQVFDFGSVDGTYFLAMEFLHGRDLLAIIRRLRDMKLAIPIPVAAFIAQQVAAGLAYAHAFTDSSGQPLGIVHRDVSPSNIMCMRTGEVKLLDFGIVRTASEALAESTDEGTIKGKLAYMSPERARNESFDGRSDIYALGVVLWEMLTRRQLFRGTSMAETIKKVMEMPIAPPSSHRPDVPAALDAVVMRAVERDVAKRYPTAQEMADDLEEVVRATKYQSRMIPGLLYDLFGSGQQSRQIEMSCVTPELMAVATTGGEVEDLVEIRTVSSMLRRGVRWVRGKTWRMGAVAGAAAMMLVLVVLLAGRHGGAHASVAPAPAAPVPTPAPMPVPAPAPLAPAPAAQTAAPVEIADGEALAEQSPLKTTKKNPVKKAKSSSRNGKNPIAAGLSIDPFAEAIARGKR